jgi:hypothetical protein
VADIQINGRIDPGKPLAAARIVDVDVEIIKRLIVVTMPGRVNRTPSLKPIVS